MLDIMFYGVRGSTPCSGSATEGYGGNTSCVLVRAPGDLPIMCDLGTGLRYLDDRSDLPDPFRGTALVSHLHWDHIQGLPFFGPILKPGAELMIVGPEQGSQSLAEEFRAGFSPPVFPVVLDDLPGTFRFHETSDDRFELESATVTVFPVTHVGPTNGYRIDCGEASVAYISDYQQPPDGSLDVSDRVIEACRDVDVLIHDAQYSPAEFAVKSDWGHCTVEYAVEVARRTGARRLVLYHHDPAHDDRWIDDARDMAAGLAGTAFDVLAAREGLALQSGAR